MNDLVQLLDAVDRDAVEQQVVVPSGARIAPIARRHGGEYRGGGWRFPSDEAKRSFEEELERAAVGRLA